MLKDERFVQQTLYPVYLFAAFCAATFASATAARAAGYVRFDSSSFLYRSETQPNAMSTVLLGPELSTEGKWLSAALDIKGVAFISNVSSFTVEAGNLYVATSPQWMPRHQVTLGRRIYDWNEMEDQWDLGLWSARFLWNPLSPERIGLTGAFYTYQSAKWRVMAFGTPVSPPERGFPIRDQGGQLLADSRDYVQPYQELQLLNQVVPIHYSIEYPPLRDLVVRPAAGMQVRYGAKDGVWSAGSYGVMPMHQVQMAIDAQYVPGGVVEATVHPITLFHHLATFEGGYRGQHWSLWGSVTGESPIQKSLPERWQMDPMGPALLSGMGGEIRLDDYFTLGTSYLRVDEEAPAPKPGAVQLNLPSRFQYKRAFRMEGRWSGVPQFSVGAKWTYDIDNRSGLVSLDLLYQPQIRPSSLLRSMFGGQGSWALGVGTDLISSATQSGYIGQYVGNDRVRGRISYAF
jgi:hypothetical protein